MRSGIPARRPPASPAAPRQLARVPRVARAPTGRIRAACRSPLTTDTPPRSPTASVTMARMEQQPSAATITRRVEWSDTDPSGHHHNTLIIRLAEAAERELMDAAGLTDSRGAPEKWESVRPARTRLQDRKSVV